VKRVTNAAIFRLTRGNSASARGTKLTKPAGDGTMYPRIESRHDLSRLEPFSFDPQRIFSDRLFDHLVGAAEERRRNCDAERRFIRSGRCARAASGHARLPRCRAAR